jgi:membrane fusion protein, multidrug efflux system
VGTEYVHNLQQQIYFLEMETQFLRSNAGEDAPNMSLSVDDQMSQLTRSFRDMEEKYRAEAEEQAENLLRLQAELTKRNKAYETLKQYIAEQQALAEANKAKQAAELQRCLEESVAAEKRAKSFQEMNEQVQAQLVTTEESLASTQTTMRELDVRTTENMKEKKGELKKCQADLKSCQDLAGGFEAEIANLNAALDDSNAKNEELTEQIAEAYAARDEAVVNLEVSELKLSEANAAHETRIADIHSLTVKNRELDTELFEAKQTIERESARNNRLQQALTESNAERGALRAKLNASEITVSQLQKRVQVQHAQRVDMSVELASARGEAEKAGTAQAAAEAKVAGVEDAMARVESENTALAARGERLGLEVAGLNEDMVGNGEMIRDLEAENAGLKRELQGARMKLEELKDLDTLDVSKFTSLMQSNLQVAQTLESFMKKSQIIKGHQQQGDGEKSDQ